MNQPKKFLGRFVWGSLIVIFVSLFSVSLWFATQHVKQEQRRASLSQRQVLEFFENQYVNFAEEMWTGAYESIANRIAEISRKLGTDDYEVFIADKGGTCVFHQHNDRVSKACVSPPELARLEASPSRPGLSALRYDERRKRNVYLVPLFVGPTSIGYLFAAVTDPFDFYRGGFFPLVFRTWLPPLLVVILFWTLWLLVSKTFLIDPYLGGLVRMKKNEALAHQAQQVAHDLKNPVATILSITRTLKGVPEDRKDLITSAAQSIREIANDLLKIGPVPLSSSQPSEKGYSLGPVVRSVIAEAQARYSERSDISISGEADDLIVTRRLEPIDLKRILHNLIANAVEAMDAPGVVRVEADETGGRVRISVTDTGKGIPAQLIPRLGTRGMTHGKSGGSGLGLFHAKETLTRIGGEFELRSEPGQWTIVTLKLPSLANEKIFLSSLSLPREGIVAILDDEEHTHRCWDVRFEECDERDFEVKHFYRAADLKKWWETLNGSKKRVLLLCDYFLGKQLPHGLEVIRELGASKHAVLVTGLAGDIGLETKCRMLNLPLLSKEQINVVPLYLN